jgi:hypothetical protein
MNCGLEKTAPIDRGVRAAGCRTFMRARGRTSLTNLAMTVGLLRGWSPCCTV